MSIASCFNQAYEVPTWFSFVWTTCNLAIFLSYVFIAAQIVPQALWRLRTKVMGTLFFATCGLTHFEMVTHLLFVPWATIASTTFTTHMIAIHVAQAFAVVTFCGLLYGDVHKQRAALLAVLQEHKR